MVVLSLYSLKAVDSIRFWSSMFIDFVALSSSVRLFWDEVSEVENGCGGGQVSCHFLYTLHQQCWLVSSRLSLFAWPAVIGATKSMFAASLQIQPSRSSLGLCSPFFLDSAFTVGELMGSSSDLASLSLSLFFSSSSRPRLINSTYCEEKIQSASMQKKTRGLNHIRGHVLDFPNVTCSVHFRGEFWKGFVSLWNSFLLVSTARLPLFFCGS